MAIRSGAGTGVIVSLVVFVLATVFLLVLSIVLYTSDRDQRQLVTEANVALDMYASERERSEDAINTISSLASASGQTVVGYLNDQLQQRNVMLTGNPKETIEQLTSQFAANTSGSKPLALEIQNLNSRLESQGTELDSSFAEIASKDNTIKDLNSQIGEQNDSNKLAVEQAKEEWKDVQTESADLNTRVDDYFTIRKDKMQEREDRNLGRIILLEEDVQLLTDEKTRLQSTVEELRKKINANRITSVDPSVLVDGNVLEVGAGNEVFIDRGKNDHIALGMTFDIYESPSQLRLDAKGNLPRGKATIEIVKVGPTTSTAKITRATSSQPIVRDNIIVNPVYDPNYKFTFLVHGNFDADGDGSTESNNSFIKDQIARWGGIVVEDKGSVQGDLDFLVLGVTPRKPTHRPASSASDAMLDAYARQQKAYEDYISLHKQAKAAQVPILTVNRLHVLTGQHSR
ncbi:MAG: hypothetical protein HOC27_02370 [Phycisphaerae bacterium]|jgi:hypothetical protein|nr:hypothetical protein [Phycisphaerae bacterium]